MFRNNILNTMFIIFNCVIVSFYVCGLYKVMSGNCSFVPVVIFSITIIILEFLVIAVGLSNF